MRRRYWMVVGGGVVLAACSLTTDLDGLTDHQGSAGDGAGGGSQASTTSVGGVGGAGGADGVGGPINGGGSGGTTDCASCGDYWFDQLDTIPFESLCGYDPQDAVCAPDSSCALVSSLNRCACGDPMTMLGLCVAQCQFTCTGIGTDSNGCGNCLANDCATESAACFIDPGTP